ncbi:hypothetical protein AB2B38_002740 [Balneola sp. MJW-20]|uniref:hypothetical protein n=1 Tax=Gracilimonas aurantiaca TaxID=3234185 RepID=UPI003465D78C
MSVYDEDRGVIFNERIRLLKENGYRGFHISEIHQDWDGFSITVKNESAKIISTNGETQEEAFQGIIDKIDMIFD